MKDFTKELCLKKWLLIMGLTIRMFVTGFEYSVILPTCLLYMKSFDAGPAFMGLVVSAYYISATIALPVVGALYDRTKRTKEIIITLNILEIVGNILYSVNVSKWFPLVGRFIAGLGDGFLACAIGEITHVYSKQDRTSMLSLLQLGRVVGVFSGPLLSFIIGNSIVYIGTWKLDFKTFPGVFMAFLWSLTQLSSICLISNMARNNSMIAARKKSDDMNQLLKCENGKNNVLFHETSKKNLDMLISPHNVDGTKKQPKHGHAVSRTLKGTFISHTGFEFAVILYIDFIQWVQQIGIEVFISYIGEFEYHWQAKWIGLVYTLGAILIIIFFALIYCTSKKNALKDHNFLLASLVVKLIQLGLVMVESRETNMTHRIVIFAFLCFLSFSCGPFILVYTKAILTKIYPSEYQGKVHGINGAVARIALIVGPVIGSIFFKHRMIYGIFQIVLTSISIAGLLYVIPILERKENQLMMLPI